MLVGGTVYGGGDDRGCGCGCDCCGDRVGMNGLKGVPTGLEEKGEKRRTPDEEKQREDNKSVVGDGSQCCNRRWGEGIVMGVVVGGGVDAAAAVVAVEEGKGVVGSGDRVAMAGEGRACQGRV